MEKLAGTIDWRSSEVHDGTLTVELDGEVRKGWPKRFKQVLVLLEHGDRWGRIALRKGTITVVDVQAGAEEDLRALLEGIVTQTNVDLRVGHDGEQASGEAQQDDAPQASDARMTDLFRSFAER